MPPTASARPDRGRKQNRKHNKNRDDNERRAREFDSWPGASARTIARRHPAPPGAIPKPLPGIPRAAGNEGNGKREEPNRHGQPCQQNGGNICEWSGESHAMKVIRQRRKHAQLQDGGNHNEFPEKKRPRVKGQAINSSANRAANRAAVWKSIPRQLAFPTETELRAANERRPE